MCTHDLVEVNVFAIAALHWFTSNFMCVLPLALEPKRAPPSRTLKDLHKTCSLQPRVNVVFQCHQEFCSDTWRDDGSACEWINCCHLLIGPIVSPLSLSDQWLRRTHVRSNCEHHAHPTTPEVLVRQVQHEAHPDTKCHRITSSRATSPTLHRCPCAGQLPSTIENVG